MRRHFSVEKPLHWVSASKKDLLTFPEEVVDEIGYALGVVQHGGTPPSAKSWKGDGAGVFEVIANVQGNTNRAVYVVRFHQTIYVLHCFQKKSPSGIRTPQHDVTLIHERLKAAQQDYEERYAKEA